MDYQSLQIKTVVELRKLAKDNGVKIPAGTNKSAMIDLLLQADAANAKKTAEKPAEKKPTEKPAGPKTGQQPEKPAAQEAPKRRGRPTGRTSMAAKPTATEAGNGKMPVIKAEPKPEPTATAPTEPAPAKPEPTATIGSEPLCRRNSPERT